MKKILVSLMMLVLITACSTDPNGNPTWGMGTKQTIGTGAGAIGGGLLGSQIGKGSGRLVGVGVGTLLGAFIGSEIGRSLDEADRAAANNAWSRATTAPIGQEITWDNPNTGHSGSYTPVREGHHKSGAYCREFQQTITVGGRVQRGYGTACRQPDGSWQIAS